MNVVGPYELFVNRSFENAEWVPTKASIAYTMNYTYSGLDET